MLLSHVQHATSFEQAIWSTWSIPYQMEKDLKTGRANLSVPSKLLSFLICQCFLKTYWGISTFFCNPRKMTPIFQFHHLFMFLNFFHSKTLANQSSPSLSLIWFFEILTPFYLPLIALGVIPSARAIFRILVTSQLNKPQLSQRIRVSMN